MTLLFQFHCFTETNETKEKVKVFKGWTDKGNQSFNPFLTNVISIQLPLSTQKKTGGENYDIRQSVEIFIKGLT